MAQSKSRIIADKTVFATFKILKEAGGEMRGRDVIGKIKEEVLFNDYEKHIFEKTGYVRWESILHFCTIDCVKAGYLRKTKGLWILTKEGEDAISLGQEKLYTKAAKIYREWDAKREKDSVNDTCSNDDLNGDKIQSQQTILEKYEEDARTGLRSFIIAKNPYEFQDLIAALLDAMGYHISNIAQRGPDGGIDIIAYTDPLGTKQPRIIVQVKHRPDDSISSDEIQKLSGTLKRTTDVGIFATSGQFSKPAIKEARGSREHIELIDFDRLISLWVEYYEKMTDEQKNMLPLHPVSFLGSNE